MKMEANKKITVNTGGTPLDDSVLENVAGGWGTKFEYCPFCLTPTQFPVNNENEIKIFEEHKKLCEQTYKRRLSGQ